MEIVYIKNYMNFRFFWWSTKMTSLDSVFYRRFEVLL